MQQVIEHINDPLLLSIALYGWVITILYAKSSNRLLVKQVWTGFSKASMWIIAAIQRHYPAIKNKAKEALRHPEVDPENPSKVSAWITLVMECFIVTPPIVLMGVFVLGLTALPGLTLAKVLLLIGTGSAFLLLGVLMRNEAIKHAKKAGIDIYPWRRWFNSKQAI